ncbi:hypothetical protein EII25_03550 [Erysipelotrichaceae bacterium OH741_COT-311]|nr:hypothetical protein EII25_03550 [Erysipelotrichaceae bacterium OH741_COT-311]
MKYFTTEVGGLLKATEEKFPKIYAFDEDTKEWKYLHDLSVDYQLDTLTWEFIELSEEEFNRRYRNIEESI